MELEPTTNSTLLEEILTTLNQTMENTTDANQTEANSTEPAFDPE